MSCHIMSLEYIPIWTKLWQHPSSLHWRLYRIIILLQIVPVWNIQQLSSRKVSWNSLRWLRQAAYDWTETALSVPSSQRSIHSKCWLTSMGSWFIHDPMSTFFTSNQFIRLHSRFDPALWRHDISIIYDDTCWLVFPYTRNRLDEKK